MPAPLNLKGQRFGRLTVTAPCGANPHGKRLWICRCDCGETTITIGSKLVSGWSTSCGCFNRQRTSESLTKHGGTTSSGRRLAHPLYSTWYGMRQRCIYPKHKDFKNYGGRGITVCDRWLRDFQAFVDDVGPRPAGMTLDRIDNDGNYEPGNVRWATAVEQANKKRPYTRRAKT